MTSNFTFAIVADAHCSEGTDVTGFTGMDRFMRCLQSVDRQPPEWQPDFMILLGDFHAWAFVNGLPETGYPLHAIAGNHEFKERKEQLRELFPDDFQVDGQSSDYYAFVHKGVRFIGVCNSGAGGDHVGHLCSQDIRPRGQMEWLERQLAYPEPRKIVFAHIPPGPEGQDDGMSMAPCDSHWFLELVARTQPMAMFFGHQHLATREERFGVTRSFVLRSAAWNFEGVPVGYMLVRVTGGGIEPREVLMR